MRFDRAHPGTDIDSAQGYFTAAMLHLDDALGRHDLLTVQALALTTMYSFRAEVRHLIKPGIWIDANYKPGWTICMVSDLSSSGPERKYHRPKALGRCCHADMRRERFPSQDTRCKRPRSCVYED